MRQGVITKAGQLSVPADVRRRWGTSRVLLDDRGDRLVIRPLPDDPISAVRGVFREARITSDEAFAQLRAEEAEIEEDRYGR